MYMLQTALTNFRFNSIHNQGPYTVEWYRLKDDDGDLSGVGLTNEELTALTHYVVNNPANFQNSNYFTATEDEVPVCGIYDLLPEKTGSPKNLVLRKNPKLPRTGGTIYPCMDIELLSQNGRLNHTFNLEFDLIGRIL